MENFSSKHNFLYFTTWFIFTTVFRLTRPEETVGQLTAEFSDLKLLTPNDCPRSYYDGEDTIYLFGGCEHFNIPVEIFSIANGTITRKSIGNFPGDARSGTVQADNFGNIFYFGGGDDDNEVYKFDPRTNQSSVVATLPVEVRYSTSVKYNDSTVYIFGGRGQKNPTTLLAFDLVGLTYTTISSNLTYWVWTAASVQVGNKVYIFDAWNGLNKTIEFDLDSFQMSLVGPGTLPKLNRHPSAVRDETHAYLIGGYEPSRGPTHGIYQFDLTTHENRFLPVENFPEFPRNEFPYPEYPTGYHHAPAAVYVKKQNRIYFFGGSRYSPVHYTHRDIFHIDLSPLSSMNFFNCFNRTNDFYPHPSDSECASYIGCRDGKIKFYECPSPLLFDTVARHCAFPEDVKCGPCKNKPNGYYPYQHDCSRYIICRAEVSHVFECPSPLLFNPATSSCRLPEEVECVLAKIH